MNNQDLILFSTCIQALANSPNANEHIELFIKNFMSSQTTTNPIQTQKSHESPSKNAKQKRRGRPIMSKIFKLTPKEISSMPKSIQKLFAYEDKVIPYRFHKGVFEVQYRRDGITIYASSKDFQGMKNKFIEKLLVAQPTFISNPAVRQPIIQENQVNRILFSDYMEQWLSTKKITVKESTYAEYERLCEKNLAVAFSGMSISDMTRSILQEYLFKYIHEGKARTAQKLHLILTCIFDLVAEDLDMKNPMKKVELPYYESTSV